MESFRDRNVGVRLNDSEYQYLKNIANYKDLNMSYIVRQLIKLMMKNEKEIMQMMDKG